MHPLNMHTHLNGHINTHARAHEKTPIKPTAQSAGAVECTDCPHNECPGYDTKQSDGEVPVMLGLWGIQSTLSLPLLPGTLWSGVLATDRVLFMG